jgi:hypothetical protein
MRAHLVLRAFYVICVLVFASGPSWAESSPLSADERTGIQADDKSAIQALVQKQLDAFQRDDGEAAFGFAGSRVHEIFDDAEDFMKTVREGYPPVYRPRSVLFGQLLETDSGPIQVVFLGGQDGLAYVALYTFERQIDGSWLIAGCLLKKNTGTKI